MPATSPTSSVTTLRKYPHPWNATAINTAQFYPASPIPTPPILFLEGKTSRAPHRRVLKRHQLGPPDGPPRSLVKRHLYALSTPSPIGTPHCRHLERHHPCMLLLQEGTLRSPLHRRAPGMPPISEGSPNATNHLPGEESYRALAACPHRRLLERHQLQALAA